MQKTIQSSGVDVDPMCILEKNKPDGRNFCGDNAYLVVFGEKIDQVGGIIAAAMCI